MNKFSLIKQRKENQFYTSKRILVFVYYAFENDGNESNYQKFQNGDIFSLLSFAVD